jgi:hypothetical protein
MIPQERVYDQIVLPSPVGAGWRIWWKSSVASSFVLAVSTDDGLTFEPLATIPFDINGANAKNGRFFYDHADGDSRYIYSLSAVGTNGTSRPVLAFAPTTAPSTCTVHGYARDLSGDVILSAHIQVNVDTQYINAEGAVAKNDDGFLLMSGERWLYFDENGHWQIELPRLAHARILIPVAGFSKLFIVPDETGPVNLRDIPSLPQASYLGTWDKSDEMRAEIVHA